MKRNLILLFSICSCIAHGQYTEKKMDAGLFMGHSVFINAAPFGKKPDRNMNPLLGIKFNYSFRSNFGLHVMAAYTKRQTFLLTDYQASWISPGNPFDIRYNTDYYRLNKGGVFGAGIFFRFHNGDFYAQQLRLVEVFVRTGLLAAKLQKTESRNYKYDSQHRYWGRYSYFYDDINRVYLGWFADITTAFNLSNRLHLDLSLPISLLRGVEDTGFKSFDPAVTVGYRF